MKENEKMTEKSIQYLKDYQAPDFTITHVSLSFSLDPKETKVSAKLKLKKLHSEDKKDLILDGVNLSLLKIMIDGKILTEKEYSLSSTTLCLHQIEKNSFTLEIENLICPEKNTSLEGLYISDGDLCTQCEAEGFRHITYFLDRPDVMASYEVILEANKELYPVLLSNGNLQASGDLDGNRHFARWQDPFAKPSYLFALVAGNLDFIQDTWTTRSGKKVDLRIYSKKNLIDRCHFALESLKNAMDWDEKTFGLEYDLDCYNIVAIPDFNMGAMENKGLNIFNSSLVLANPQTATDSDYQAIEAVIAHEYFHNWTGNRVTCRDWFQLCLKEGLTVFRDQEFSQDMGSRSSKRIDDIRLLQTAQWQEDDSPMAHPPRPHKFIEINNFYTHTVYMKGSEVVRMLHTYLGRDDFRKGMDLYFERHDGQAVTQEDFVAAMADASGKDLAGFMRWYRQAGTPTVKCEEFYVKEDNTYLLKFKQIAPKNPGLQAQNWQPVSMPLNLALLDAKTGEKLPLKLKNSKIQGEQEALLCLEKEEEIFTFENISSKPQPSLFRNFSSAIRLDWTQNIDDLMFQMAHDDDPFNCWQAAQKIYQDQIFKLVSASKKTKELKCEDKFLSAIESILKHKKFDPSFKALAIRLPSEKALSQQKPLIEVEPLSYACQVVRENIANVHKKLFIELYEKNTSNQAYSFNPEELGKRLLKNVSLAFLAETSGTEKEDFLKLTFSQFKNANNMSDCFSALQTLAHTDSPFRQEALDVFYDKWQKDRLVMDRWFQAQAVSRRKTAFSDVKKLLNHPDFDMKNPNRLRSLLASFFYHNWLGFHQKDGSGYTLCADYVLQMNTVNRQMAASLLRALGQWNRHDDLRSKMMFAELKRLDSHKNLVSDVREILNAYLNASR